MLRPGYKYEPLVVVKTVQNQINSTGPVPTSSLCRVVEFIERGYRSVDLRKFRQPCYHVYYHAVDLDVDASSLVCLD